MIGGRAVSEGVNEWSEPRMSGEGRIKWGVKGAWEWQRGGKYVGR
jgi:hypothetical protein